MKKIFLFFAVASLTSISAYALEIHEGIMQCEVNSSGNLTCSPAQRGGNPTYTYNGPCNESPSGVWNCAGAVITEGALPDGFKVKLKTRNQKGM